MEKKTLSSDDMEKMVYIEDACMKIIVRCRGDIMLAIREVRNIPNAIIVTAVSGRVTGYVKFPKQDDMIKTIESLVNIGWKWI
jgi:hypothetical protein